MTDNRERIVPPNDASGRGVRIRRDTSRADGTVGTDDIGGPTMPVREPMQQPIQDNVRETTMPIAPTAPGRPNELVQSATMVSPQDRVRWGPVWAGLLTALPLFLALELLAYALGLLTTTSTSGSVTASGASPWISGILGLIAFFVGGFIAERSSAARGGGAGLLNGFMVWALGMTLILVLSVLGLGTLFGALGTAIGEVIASGGRLVGTSGANANQVAQMTQTAALGAFFSMLISAIAAALGGLLGSIGSPIGRVGFGRIVRD